MGRALGDMVVRIVGENSELDKSIDQSHAKVKIFLDTMGKVGKALTISVTAPLLAFAAVAIKEWNNQVEAIARLDNAIKQTGKTASISSRSIQELAGALQMTTVYADDVTISAAAILQQLADLDQNGLQSLIPRIADFASAMQLDLVSAAELVGKTIGSSTNALGRYGIVIAEGSSKSEKLAQIMEQLNTKFGGTAEAVGKTQQLTLFKNQLGELAESIGAVLLPVLNDILQKITPVISSVANMDVGTKKIIVTMLGFAAAAGPVAMAIKAIGTAFTTSTGPIGLVIAGVAALAVGIAALIARSQKLKNEQEFVNKALAGGLNTSEEYTEALATLQERRDKDLKSIEELKKGYTDMGVTLRDTTYMGMRVFEILNDRGEIMKRISLEGIRINEKEMIANQENIKAVTKLRDAKLKEEEADRNAAIKKEADERTRLQALADRLAKIKEIHKVVEEASKSEYDLIKDEIASLKELGITDAEIMAYMKATHKEYYKTEQAESEKTTEIIIANREAEVAAMASNAQTQIQFYQSFKSEFDQELNRIDAERQAFVDAGIDKANAEKWAQEEIDKARAESAKKEMARISEVGNIVTTAMGAIRGVVESDSEDMANNVINAAGKIAGAIGGVEGQAFAMAAGILSSFSNLMNSLRDKIMGTQEAMANQYEELQIEIINNQIEAVKMLLEAQLDAIDEQEQAALEAAGLQELTTGEQLEERLKALQAEIAATQDAEEQKKLLEEKAELDKEIAKEKIRQEYQEKRDAAEEAANVKIRQYEYDKAALEKTIAIAQAKIAEQKAIADLGWFNRAKKEQVAALYADLIAAIEAIPLPALAAGGIIPATPGGQPFLAGEGGEPEAVIPLSKITELLSPFRGGGGAGEDLPPILVNINMDHKVLYSGIHQASRNREILFDVGALTGG